MADTLSNPPITKEFLEEVLGYPIESFTVEIGSNPGDNFMSNLFRINVILTTTKDQSQSSTKEYLLLKCFPNHPARQDLLEKTNIFIKEIEVYTKWIPNLEKLQNDFLQEEKHLEIPYAKFYTGQSIDYADDEIKENTTKNIKHVKLGNYLLFQDLRKTSNYKMADRLHGLDFNHCELVLKELAKVHALSWAYKQKYGLQRLTDKFPFFQDSMFNPKMDAEFQNMQAHVRESTMAVLKNAFPDETCKEYLAAEKFIQNEFFEIGKLFVGFDGIDEELLESKLRIKPVNSEGFNKDQWLFGCHGDSWVNNFLFKYDENTGKPIKLKLVDLQMVREACPTTDLAYFLYSSTTFETRKKHLDKLLQIYLDEFIKVNGLFGTSLPSGFNFQTLKRRLHRAKFFGFLMSLFLLPVILTPPSQSKNLDHEGHDKNIAEVFNTILGSDESNPNTNLQGRLQELIHEFYNDGVI